MTSRTMPLDIRALRDLAVDFEARLNEVKARIDPKDYAWYPYDCFGTLSILEGLLTGENRFLLELAGPAPILDVGCADGALSFLLESLGAEVHAIDNPDTNYNSMLGVRDLARALGSSVTIYSLDLDAQFALSGQIYGLALFFGTLYHLKNPYYVLETLARHANYCLLSTRIARLTPGAELNFQAEPMAYLVEEDQLNRDPTNFWIFSDAGLRRLVRRTGWEILNYTTIGCQDGSDPVRADRDERAFCLLKSRLTNPGKAFRLLEGWHRLEQDAWRWTERRFSVLMRPAAEATTLEFRFHITEAMLARLGTLTLRARLAGIDLPQASYATPGEHVYSQPLPAGLPASGTLRADFELDQAIPSTGDDIRELGVIVVFRQDRVFCSPFALL